MYGPGDYARLAGVSIAHLYNLRKAAGYTNSSGTGARRGQARGHRRTAQAQSRVCAAALGMCDRTSKSLSHPRSRGE